MSITFTLKFNWVIFDNNNIKIIKNSTSSKRLLKKFWSESFQLFQTQFFFWFLEKCKCTKPRGTLIIIVPNPPLIAVLLQGGTRVDYNFFYYTLQEAKHVQRAQLRFKRFDINIITANIVAYINLCPHTNKI